MTEKQVGRYTQKEIDLIKSTFKDNEDLLRAIRKVSLQIDLDALDLSRLEVIRKSPDMIKTLYKHFLPTIDGSEPIGTPTDMWASVDMKNRMFEDALPIIEANGQLIEYLTQQMKELEGKEVHRAMEFPDFCNISNKIEKTKFIDLITRNTIIVIVEQRLLSLMGLANKVELTPEEKEKKSKIDSNQ